MKEEKIIEKIRKCLALAQNNPSEEEAKAAALQAQKLLAKYGISAADVQATKEIEEIEESVIWFKDCVKNPSRAWKINLASIVANNFRCRHFFYGKGAVVFYGHKTDAEAAAEVFKFLFSMGDRLADRETHRVFREYQKQGRRAVVSGVYNSWVSGFMVGLRDSLAQQCTALALVVPQDVKDAYIERSKNFGYMKSGMRQNKFDREAYEKGKQVGREAMGQRSLEG